MRSSSKGKSSKGAVVRSGSARSNAGSRPRAMHRPQGGDVAQAASAAASMARQLPKTADISIAVRTGGHVLSVTPEDKKKMPEEEMFHTPPRASTHARRPRGSADDIGRNSPGKLAAPTPPKFCAAYARGSRSCGDCRGGTKVASGASCQDELCHQGKAPTKHSKSEEPSPKGQARRRSEPRPRCCCLIRITDESRVTFDLT